VRGISAGGVTHQCVDRAGATTRYLEIGGRSADDTATYPADDLEAQRDGASWCFTHKDGKPY